MPIYSLVRGARVHDHLAAGAVHRAHDPRHLGLLRHGDGQAADHHLVPRLHRLDAVHKVAGADHAAAAVGGDLVGDLGVAGDGLDGAGLGEGGVPAGQVVSVLLRQ